MDRGNRSGHGKLKYDNKSVSAAVTHGSNNANGHVKTTIEVEDWLSSVESSWWVEGPQMLEHFSYDSKERKKGEEKPHLYTFLSADDRTSNMPISICSHWVCVCVFWVFVRLQTAQGVKAGCGIAKIISLPDGKTSHIPFEVPHMIPSVCGCMCVVGAYTVCSHTFFYWPTWHKRIC